MFKHIYAVETEQELREQMSIKERFMPKFLDFMDMLRASYKLIEMPRAIIWTKYEVASSILSSIIYPAYTNDVRIVIDSSTKTWARIFKGCFKNVAVQEVQHYFENLPEEYVLSLLGHELTHHLDLFETEFTDDEYVETWFEEGMCHFLSRKFFMDEGKFNELLKVERELYFFYKENQKLIPLHEFGSKTYEREVTDIIQLFYTRSFLMVNRLVDEVGRGNPLEVFRVYKEWVENKKGSTLFDFFGIKEY